MAAGLASRAEGLPAWVHAYVGDGLYAVLIYCIVGLFTPRERVAKRAFVTLAVCYAIEASQAWHPAWLDALRSKRLVALVLGRGFLWSDLVAYAVGVAGAVGLESCPSPRLPGRGCPKGG